MIPQASRTIPGHRRASVADEQNDHFGSGDDLKALSSALHARGMYLMVDIVVNHVAATSSGDFKVSHIAPGYVCGRGD